MNLVVLKILGFVFMIIDHLGILFNLFPLRLIGRLSFPIFAFCVANGVLNTKNCKKYLLRLSLLAIVSEIPFDLFMFGKLSFETQNVFFTFLLGAICIVFFHWVNFKNFEAKFFILAVVNLLLCVFLSVILNFDYAFYGIAIIYSFYFIQISKHDLDFMYVFLIYWLWRTFDGFGIIGVLSLILIKVYNPDKPFNKKINRLLYIVYPVHFIILLVLRWLV